MNRKTVVLMVLDGWGLRDPAPDNAITEAPAAHFADLWQRYPHTQLQAHGEAVGLIAGQVGDSNVGHLTIGAGRVVFQNLARVFRAIDDGSLAASPVLAEAFERARGRRLHLFGLLSDGGVHSHQEHLFALLRMERDRGVGDVALHLALDGRDVPPESGMRYLAALADALGDIGVGRVATLMGRYYGMDRDNRWERTELAYRAMVEAKGPRARSAPEALAANYQAGRFDEFVLPTVVVDEDGEPVGPIAPEDPVFLFNFRADRVRQLLHALADPAFTAFARPAGPVAWVGGMTLYDENFPVPHVFPPQDVPDNLAEWLSKRGLTQFHVAETEKYAHVTFFFNGGVERPYPGEDRTLIPSPKVATYDLQPEMSAAGITDAVLKAIAGGAYDFILLNYANSDMLGHTGKLDAARAGVRAVDQGIGQIADAVLAHGDWLVITADHGNAERMLDAYGEPDTNHTDAPVPLVVVGADAAGLALDDGGGLADVAPTVLWLMGQPIPAAMTGRVLAHTTAAKESDHA